ncbi:methylated-DNA--protein-cysteine methyltransferase, partial [Microbacterium sp. H6]
MTALIQTIETPDGAFTILADDHQRVLASGWTSDVEAILGRLSAANRPEALRDG